MQLLVAELQLAAHGSHRRVERVHAVLARSQQDADGRDLGVTSRLAVVVMTQLNPPAERLAVPFRGLRADPECEVYAFGAAYEAPEAPNRLVLISLDGLG